MLLQNAKSKCTVYSTIYKVTTTPQNLQYHARVCTTQWQINMVSIQRNYTCRTCVALFLYLLLNYTQILYTRDSYGTNAIEKLRNV